MRLDRSVKPSMRWVHCPNCGGRADRVEDAVEGVATFHCAGCGQDATAQIDPGNTVSGA